MRGWRQSGKQENEGGNKGLKCKLVEETDKWMKWKVKQLENTGRNYGIK